MSTDAATNNNGDIIACGVIMGANGRSTNASGMNTSGAGNASTNSGGTITSTRTVTSTGGVTNTAGAPTTLPVTGGGSDNSGWLLAVLALGVLLLTGGYLVRRNSQA
jgi:LPXTG-motif cell wall-anchored protein